MLSCGPAGAPTLAMVEPDTITVGSADTATAGWAAVIGEAVPDEPVSGGAAPNDTGVSTSSAVRMTPDISPAATARTIVRFTFSCIFSLIPVGRSAEDYCFAVTM